MNELVLAVGSLILGIVASVWVSGYYFRRSHTKSLTPYIQYSSSPFSGLDPAVRKALNINYQGVPIADLFEIQFIIANTGDKAIRDVIEPLTLPIPEGCALLNVAIIHRSPAELRVTTSVAADRRSISSDFPLLNSGDFFIIKLLLNGVPKDNKINFSITVDELPPILKSERLPYDAVATSSKRQLEFPLLGIGLAFVLCGLSQFKVIYDGWGIVPTLRDGLGPFFSSFSFGALALLLSILPTFIFTLLGAMLSAAAFADGSFPPKKRKFIVPDHVHGRRLRFIIHEKIDAGTES